MENEEIFSIINKAEAAGIDLFIEDDKLKVRKAKNRTVDEALLKLIQAHKDDIKLYLLEVGFSKHAHLKIQRTGRGVTSRIPLSFSQERLWFIDRLQGSIQYHMPWVFRVKGALDVALLEASFRELITRHEVLRTVIREEDGVGYQEILRAENWRLGYTAPAGVIKGDKRLEEYVYAFTQKPYDLSADYMLRAEVIVLSAEESIDG